MLKISMCSQISAILSNTEIVFSRTFLDRLMEVLDRLLESLQMLLKVALILLSQSSGFNRKEVSLLCISFGIIHKRMAALLTLFGLREVGRG